MRTITDLITPFFRSLSNSESYLKDFRREGEFAFWKVNQSPHSGSSCAGTTLAHRQAKCHVMCFGSGTDVTQPQQYNTKSKTYTGYRRRKHHSSSNGTVFWESIMTLFLSHTEQQNSAIGRSSEGGGLLEVTCQLNSRWVAIILNKSYQKITNIKEELSVHQR